MMDLISSVRLVLSSHVPHVVPPPYRPMVVAGAFGTGKRQLLARLFEALPGRFAVPVITTTRAPGPDDPDSSREGMVVVPRAEADAIQAAGGFATYREVLGEVYGITTAAIKKVGASGRVPVVEVDHVEDASALRARGFDATYLFIGMEDMGKLLTVIHEVGRSVEGGLRGKIGRPCRWRGAMGLSCGVRGVQPLHLPQLHTLATCQSAPPGMPLAFQHHA